MSENLGIIRPLNNGDDSLLHCRFFTYVPHTLFCNRTYM